MLANLYGPSGQAIVTTDDIDLFLPLDADNLLRAWTACEAADLDIWHSTEPLERPRDRWLAEQVVARRAPTRVTGPDDHRQRTTRYSTLKAIVGSIVVAR
jgi:hypothetical protein